MKKEGKIVIAVIAVLILGIIVLAVNAFSGNNSKPEVEENNSGLNIKSYDELASLVDKIYKGLEIEMPALMTLPVDTTDNDVVQMYTGLSSAEDIEYAVVSEPMMSAQAYSMVLVKVKDGADVDAVAKTINEKVDERRWICVTAEKIYTATSGDIICLVMSNSDTAKAVYDNFKTIAGSIDKEYERTAEEPEMPEDMLPGQDGLAF